MRSARPCKRSSAPASAPRVVSGGSTPTLWNTHELTGVTEFRPGTYVYNDRGTAAIGACDWDDCALTVLATVVSTAVPNQAVVDAGTKALGREPMRGADSRRRVRVRARTPGRPGDEHVRGARHSRSDRDDVAPVGRRASADHSESRVHRRAPERHHRRRARRRGGDELARKRARAGVPHSPQLEERPSKLAAIRRAAQSTVSNVPAACLVSMCTVADIPGRSGRSLPSPCVTARAPGRAARPS